jgi:hypothetical protein
MVLRVWIFKTIMHSESFSLLWIRIYFRIGNPH